MKRLLCTGILSAAAVAACVDAQVHTNVYSLGIHSAGTTYWPVCSFAFAHPPFNYKLTDREWYETTNGLHIIGINWRDQGGIFHRALDVQCGSESLTVPLEPAPLVSKLWDALAPESVLSLVMETGSPAVTLTAVVDGSAGLYSTNGGRISKAGHNPQLDAAARKLLATAAELRSVCTSAKEFPPPQEAHTRFYIITPNHVLTAETPVATLVDGGHKLSPLYQAAQGLIAQLRLAQGSNKAEPDASPNGGPPAPPSNSDGPGAGRHR